VLCLETTKETSLMTLNLHSTNNVTTLPVYMSDILTGVAHTVLCNL